VIFGNIDVRDAVTTHSIENLGGNYRCRHFKVASVENEPSVFEFGYKWGN